MTFVHYLPLLLRGALITFEVTSASAALALVISFAVGLIMLARRRTVRFFARVYIEFFRGTSLLVQMFWLFYVLPLLGLTLNPFLVGIGALGLNLGAYGAEVVRGGILAVPSGQFDAANALDFTPRQRFVHVVLPQAVRIMLPSFSTLLIVLLKASSLVSLITLGDLTFEAQALRSTYGHTVLIYSMVLVMYFLMSWLISTGMRLLERRQAVRYGIHVAPLSELALPTV